MHRMSPLAAAVQSATFYAQKGVSAELAVSRAVALFPADRAKVLAAVIAARKASLL